MYPTYEPDGRCTACERKVMRDKAWRVLSTDEQYRLRHIGWNRGVARGLCVGCYSAARRNGTLADYDRVNGRTGDVLEEWEWLADPLRPLKAEIRRLAPRLGMREKALEARLYRAGVRSRYEGGWGERVKAA